MPTVKGTPLEGEEQAAFFQWAAYNPELEWMFAVPNGGKRNAREARNLKLQGVKAGVSDIFLPVPKGQYHGLFIEMKVGKNKPTAKQMEFMQYASNKGYAVAVCYGCNEAMQCVRQYLAGG